jgi:hypothetical protein
MKSKAIDTRTPEGMLAFALKVCDEGERERRGKRRSRKAEKDAERAARVAADIESEIKRKKK